MKFIIFISSSKTVMSNTNTLLSQKLRHYL